MKIKSTLLVFGAMLLAGISHAQDGWNWPSDPAQEAKLGSSMLPILTT